MISASQCRSARTLLRWSVSKLASAASVSESAIDDFELERRQPNGITAEAIQRAFEDVGVVFLPPRRRPIAERRVGSDVITAASVARLNADEGRCRPPQCAHPPPALVVVPGAAAYALEPGPSPARRAVPSHPSNRACRSLR